MTKPRKEVYLAGYSDRLSARPGDTVAFKVSSLAKNGKPVKASLKYSISADPNPNGPGMEEGNADAYFEPMKFPSRRQTWEVGSSAVSSQTIKVPSDAKEVQIHLWCYPTLIPQSENEKTKHAELGNQFICSYGPLDLYIDPTGLAHVSCNQSVIASVSKPLRPRKWYKCCLNIFRGDGDETTTAGGETETETEGDATGGATVTLTIATGTIYDPPQVSTHALPSRDIVDTIFNTCAYFYMATNGTFNGKLEAPIVLMDGSLVASWDLSQDMTRWSIPAAGPEGGPLILKNAPTRAVKGRLWDGSEMNWQHAAGSHYAAIYFHDDDVYDFEWETDFVWKIPQSCPSRIYIMRIEVQEDVEEDEDHHTDDEEEVAKAPPKRHYDAMPIFVCPPIRTSLTEPRSVRVCVLVSTFTYAIYGNHARPDWDDSWLDRIREWKAYPNNPAKYPDYGWSTYNYHSDGVAGIAHACHRRPLFNLRPGYQTFGYSTCSGLRHFPADSHLIAWLHKKNIEYEIITDDELDKEGLSCIDGYKCLVTGTHPEYHTKNTLDALEAYLDRGGNLAYLGGNGFYWRIVRHYDDPYLLEIRRNEGGIRAWEAECGEYYSGFEKGAYGGLWRRNGRPPQQLSGVGFTAQGNFFSVPYQRVCRDPQFDWVFEGIDKDVEILGDFGLSGGAAAGFELDRVDPHLIEEYNITILAHSVDDKDHRFVLVPEEVLTHITNLTGGAEQDAKRADMIHYKRRGVGGTSGGQVFSVGSICFCGSLPHNDFDNNISTIVFNVIQHFTKPPAFKTALSKLKNSVRFGRTGGFFKDAGGGAEDDDADGNEMSQPKEENTERIPLETHDEHTDGTEHDDDDNTDGKEHKEADGVESKDKKETQET